METKMKLTTLLRSPPEKQIAENSMEAAYARLAAAIVKSAITDYSNALEGMLRAETRAVRKHHIDVKRQAEMFFRSKWFEELCDLDPYAIMAALEDRAVKSAIKAEEKSIRKALSKGGYL